MSFKVKLTTKEIIVSHDEYGSASEPREGHLDAQAQTLAAKLLANAVESLRLEGLLNPKQIAEAPKLVEMATPKSEEQTIQPKQADVTKSKSDFKSFGKK
jgi:hypothetical protein